MKNHWFSCAKISKTASVSVKLNLIEYCIVLFVLDKLSLYSLTSVLGCLFVTFPSLIL